MELAALALSVAIRCSAAPPARPRAASSAILAAGRGQTAGAPSPRRRRTTVTDRLKSFEQRVAKAADGLFYPSETDAPVEPFVMTGFEDEELTPEALLAFTERDAETPVETAELDAFFAPLVEEQDWHGPEERGAAKRFGRLRRLLERSLRDIRVFRVGERELDVYVLGRTRDGRFAGIRTRAVET